MNEEGDSVQELGASDDEGVTDERKHRQLLDAISSLDGKKKHRLSQRTVLTNEISEFNFASGGSYGSKVQLHELVGTLKDSVSHGSLKKQLSSVDKKKKVVAVPLPKHEKEKIDRSIAFDKTVTDITKWDPVVRKNRQAEQMKFPLQKHDLRMITTDQFVQRFQPRTPLEVEVAALLRGSDNVIQNKQQELTPAEQRALQAMDIEEAKERRAELMKYRALMSYKEAKARRQKKIKSKSFHRILKKEKLKVERKGLEGLATSDPDGYVEKMKQLEKDRIEERMSLKHRGGSKYAKRQMIFAKYDDTARQQVQDMLQASRELTQKVAVDSDSESDGDQDTRDPSGVTGSHVQSGEGYSPWVGGVGEASRTDNPWMMKPRAQAPVYTTPGEVVNVVTDSEGSDCEVVEKATNTAGVSGKGNDTVHVTGTEQESELFLTSLMKDLKKTQKVDKEKLVPDVGKNDQIDNIFDNVKNKSNIGKKAHKHNRKNKRKQKGNNNEVRNEEKGNDGSDQEDEPLISEGLSRKRTFDEVASLANEEPKQVQSKQVKTTKNAAKRKKKEKPSQKPVPKDAVVDPKKLFTMDVKLRQVGAGPDIVGDGETDVDAEEQQRMTIAQAFADDDVIDEFRREKDEEVEKARPKDIDLSLPGWGDWGGSGIVPSKRKKKRFIIKAPPAAPRRDMHLGHVILTEQKAPAVGKHQVSELPFPYTNVSQFESTIRAPLGKTWNPETAYRQLVKRKVVTKLGKVIAPIDKAEVFKNTPKQSVVKPGMAFDNKDKTDTAKKRKHIVSKPGSGNKQTDIPVNKGHKLSRQSGKKKQK